MPRNGAWVLSEFRGKPIDVSCKLCGSHWSYQGDDLLTEFGDVNMPGLLGMLAKREGCGRVHNAYYDRCSLVYEKQLHEHFAAGNQKAKGRTLADISEWLQLHGKCQACGQTKKINHGALERRYGKGADLDTLMSKLACSACGNREGNRLLASKMPR